MIFCSYDHHKWEENGRAAEGLDGPEAGQTSQLKDREHVDPLQRYLRKKFV